MKLYMSSYKLGNEISFLKQWINEHGNKIVLIPNSRDLYPDSERLRDGILKDKIMLEEVGFDVSIISLKDYFGNSEKLFSDFKEYNAFFVMGGNSFVLRKAMQLSGFDEYIMSQLENKDFLYAGYSAGICVLSPNMKGLDLIDDAINPYNNEPVIYDGLNIIEYVPVPHYKSNHPESHLVDNVVNYMYENDIKFLTLCDGDVFIDERLNKNT